MKKKLYLLCLTIFILSINILYAIQAPAGAGQGSYISQFFILVVVIVIAVALLKGIKKLKETSYKSEIKEGVFRGRFPALRTISSLFKILAWIVGGIAVILFVLTAAGISQFSRETGLLALLPGLIVLLIGGFHVLVLVAFSEGILVFLAIEENTRQLGDLSEIVKDSGGGKTNEKIKIKENDTEVKKNLADEEAIEKKEAAIRDERRNKENDEFLKY